MGGSKVKLTVQEITDQMWSSRNFLANVKSEDGKYLTASCGYRGPIATQEVDDEVAKIQAKMQDDFVSWIPNNIKSSIITVPPEGTAMSGTFVANTTAIKGVFQRISAQFAKMYKRKAFLHWYKGEGMDLDGDEDEDDEDDEDGDGDDDEDGDEEEEEEEDEDY